MKSLVLLILLALLAGCVSFPPAVSNDNDLAPPSRHVVVDQRPPSDSQYQMLSYLVSSCLYGSGRKGDADTMPSKMAVLEHYIDQVFGSAIDAHSVVIERYFIIVTARDFPQTFRDSAPGGGGLVAAIVTPTHCKKQDMGDAWFEDDEMEGKSPGRAQVVVLQIDFSVDGHRDTVRVVRLAGKPPFDGSNPQWVATVFAAMRDASTQVVDRIAARTGLERRAGTSR